MRRTSGCGDAAILLDEVVVVAHRISVASEFGRTRKVCVATETAETFILSGDEEDEKALPLETRSSLAAVFCCVLSETTSFVSSASRVLATVVEDDSPPRSNLAFLVRKGSAEGST